ncbi:HNH/ENDO VII family nuclease [Gordonia sp. ABSL49_1]
MKRGNAPIGHDGNPLNLHHIGQRDNSPIVELTQQVHKENHGLLHINPSSTPSGINRSAFDSWRGRYWRARRHDFT